MADVKTGDLVQIRVGAVDVTNGVVSKAGWMYVDGHSRWMTVDGVYENWQASASAIAQGVPKFVTKVRCSYTGVVVWQVQPEDIIPQVIRASDPPVTEPEEQPPTSPTTTEGTQDLSPPDRWGGLTQQVGGSSVGSYAMKEKAQSWKGKESVGISSTEPHKHLGAVRHETVDIGSALTAAFPSTGDTSTITYPQGKGWRKLTVSERNVIGPDMWVDDAAIQESKFSTSVDVKNRARRKLIINDNEKVIQNDRGFPHKLSTGKDPFEDPLATELLSAQYDYRINISDPRYPLTGKTLEDSLQEVRASFHIPVHGSNAMARAMKYYLYNRYKTPDINSAHNRSITHIFFTRPDLNILRKEGGLFTANNQCMNHTESAMIWRRYPEIFKLLTDSRRCNDPDNFNMLLSNQVRSFDIIDENLTTKEVGKNWNEYSMMYGDAYSGRTAGEFSCSFDETNDYSIINMMKLWIAYIDNVARGAWSPSYNLAAVGEGVASSLTLNSSHVFTKTLDYAASVYVIKCDPTGENILYWTKYYGVFPTNTGVSALSYDADNSLSGTPKLSIKFAYSYKKDLSPISLIELNHNAHINPKEKQQFEMNFDPSQNQSGRPIVGAPFVSLKLANPIINNAGVNYDRELTKIRLHFKPATETDSRLTDSLVYRYDLSSRTLVGAYGRSDHIGAGRYPIKRNQYGSSYIRSV